MRIAIDLNDVVRDYTNQFIKCYQKLIDPSFDITEEKVTDFDFFDIFPFPDQEGNTDKDLYYRFKYEDAAYDLFGRAEVMDKKIPSEMSLWLQNTLRNFEYDKIPEVLFVSPFEMNLSIQSTLSFLARIGTRVREVYFPTDSMTIWDRCDLLITANPKLIENVPEGKKVFKINAPYNKNTKADYTYDNLIDVIHDENNVLSDIIENYGDTNV